MSFNSYTFLIFLFTIIVVSRSINSWSLRKTFLLFSSYVFYAAWNPPFVLLLCFSTIADWIIAKKIFTSKSLTQRRLLVFCSVLLNLGLLAFFKYSTFLIGNVSAFLDLIEINLSIQEPDIILPVGISFYTFQTLSYTLDVYRKNTEPGQSFLDYALYVTFFPQLVAGPIVRATEFLPQCHEEKKGSATQIGWGLTLFSIGLFTKVVIADGLMAPVVDKVYDSSLAVTFLESWCATFAFSVQIFSDFFGYSTCAIGVALCLGFALPDNFRSPYAAVGFSDFWRRWHISLSTWLRDYLYISLGGNRKGPWRTMMNLSITMLLGGLWHGSSWMFVIWGGLHAFYLIVERGLSGSSLAQWKLWHRQGGRVLLAMLTFLLVCVTWVFFRATNLDRAWTLITAMTDLNEFQLTLLSITNSSLFPQAIDIPFHDYVIVFSVLVCVLMTHWRLRESNLEVVFAKTPWPLQSALLAIMNYLTLISMTGESRAFIYFQF